MMWTTDILTAEVDGALTAYNHYSWTAASIVCRHLNCCKGLAGLHSVMNDIKSVWATNIIPVTSSRCNWCLIKLTKLRWFLFALVALLHAAKHDAEWSTQLQPSPCRLRFHTCHQRGMESSPYSVVMTRLCDHRLMKALRYLHQNIKDISRPKSQPVTWLHRFLQVVCCEVLHLWRLTVSYTHKNTRTEISSLISQGYDY